MDIILNCDQLEEVDIELYNDQVYFNDSLSLQVDSPVNLADCEDEDDQIELEEPEYNDNDDDLVLISPAKKKAPLTCV